jgi:hypothetical protein
MNLNWNKTEAEFGLASWVRRILMRRAIMAVVSVTILTALAQPTACWAQGGLPYGTYNRTCQNIRMNGDTLSASCQKADGGWHNTSIDYRSCRGSQIINDNGYLRCGGGQEGWHSNEWRGGLPPGDYKRTCKNLYMEGDKLSGTCQKAGGGWNDTSLKNVRQCRTRIVNDNGNLLCAK